MSTLSSNPATPQAVAAQRLPLNYGTDQPAPLYYGLTLATWLKIGLLSILMLALYRFNLARLWAKTNPINGQGNWEHAILIPIVGLLYLYVWREDLVKSRSATLALDPAITPPTESWSTPAIWALGVGLASVLVALPLAVLFAFRQLPDLSESSQIGSGIALLGLCIAWGGWLYFKSKELTSRVWQARLTNVWHAMGLWTLAFFMVSGIFFFLFVLLPGSMEIMLKAFVWLSVAGIAGAMGWILLSSKSETVRKKVDRVLASSSGWFGGFIMVWGILFSLWGIWPAQNDFFKDIGMVISLFGLVLLTTSWSLMAVAWFPILFLFCAIPWPDTYYSQLAMPLQNLAAKVGVWVLRATGVDAGQTGTKIWMKDALGAVDVLNVEEACAGIKSLMTFISIGATVAFFSNRLLWQKLSIVAMAIPIAILCNTGRIAGQGLLHRYVSHEWSAGFAHGFVGLVLIIPGFGLIWLVSWIVDHLFIEEADEPVPARSGPAARKIVTRAKPAVGPGPTSLPSIGETPVEEASPAMKPAAVLASGTSTPSAPKSLKSIVPPTQKTAGPTKPVVPPRPGMVPPRSGTIPPRPGLTPRPAGSAGSVAPTNQPSAKPSGPSANPGVAPSNPS